MNTFHIHIKGIVQGVGFRPFVYQLAKDHQINGCVSNTKDGVHIEFNGTTDSADRFREAVVSKAPALSTISSVTMEKVAAKDFKNFIIQESDAGGEADIWITPDFAICSECRSEIKDSGDRRFQYAFTTCTNCGPRYSIVQNLPYDRHLTTMAPFVMCPNCKNEYNSPVDRRFYSQTNSCLDCSISLSLYNESQKLITEDANAIISEIPKLWRQGHIIAIKGIGGYAMTCDAGNSKAIQKLRQRKHRPTKPFALMFPNLLKAKSVVKIGNEEEHLLLSSACPIVLVPIKKHDDQNLDLQGIAPGLNQLGVTLAYTPLFELLLDEFKQGIVFTSGNLSNAPIIYNDANALNELNPIADYVVTNNRDILHPQDDSVVKFSTETRRKITIRRSRGIAPGYYNDQLSFGQESRIATGADLKSTFAINHKQNCYISQYIGDLDSFDTQQSYKHLLNHFLDVFQPKPSVILSDLHPLYWSSRIGEDMAKKFKTPIVKCQHHLAHFAAVLGENNLVNANQRILGVIWDGTGYGDDGQIWGGEFFTYSTYTFNRISHIEYYPWILGDKMSREPRLSALVLADNQPGTEELLKKKFSDTEWQLYQNLLRKKQPVLTSSMGRIFDAVATLLGLLDKANFEGEAAMYLEELARMHTDIKGMAFTYSFGGYNKLTQTVSAKALIRGVLLDLKKGKDNAEIAARFHYSLIQIILRMAEDLEIDQIAFSGGVFQNSLLIDMIDHHFKKDIKLYFHRDLSPNDENISFGQLIYYQIMLAGNQKN
ncbi:MAG: carbamoyltransferase HypF [Bacteroidia bacterium]|nr:carbamoyltransferase HypF [Bacteroidia bacterium]